MSPPDGGPDRVVPPAQGEPGLRAEATPFAPVGGSSSPSCTPLLFNSLHSPGPVEPGVWHRPGANCCPNFQPGGREENQEEVRQRGNAFAILGEPDEPAALAPYPTGQGAEIALPPEPCKPGTPAEAALLRRPAEREDSTATEEPEKFEGADGTAPKSRNSGAPPPAKVAAATNGVSSGVCKVEESRAGEHHAGAESSAAAASPDKAATPPELSECVRRDAELLKKLGWKKFVLQRRTKSDFTSLDEVNHPAKRLLKHYKSRGTPVKFSTEP